MTEKDPLGKDQHEKGSKLDEGKIPIYQGLVDYFPRACLAVANVSFVGARKYTWKGWAEVPNGIIRYTNALCRHLFAEPIEGPVDKDTKLLHAEQVAWNSFARLELILIERENELKKENV